MTLVALPGWDSGALIAAAGVDVESAKQPGLTVDGEVRVAGDWSDPEKGSTAGESRLTQSNSKQS
jgi:hypothetical protein